MRSKPAFLAAALISATPAAGLADTVLDRDTAMKMLSTGSRWAEIEGKLEPDGTFTGKDVEIIEATATQTSQMEITGFISALDPSAKSFEMVGYKILWNDQTQIIGTDNGNATSSDLANEKHATAAGQLRPDGTFAAKKLRLREIPIRGGKPRKKQELVGPVEILDAASGKLRVLKSVVQLKPTCEFKLLAPQAQSAPAKP